jgi:hypothetical protein
MLRIASMTRRQRCLLALATLAALASFSSSSSAVVPPGRDVEIVNVDGRCLDHGPGGRVLTWGCHGGDNQRWTISTDGTIRNGDLCLDAALGRMARRTAAIVWECHGGANQHWTIEGDGTIRNDGLCLDRMTGTSVSLWPCHGGDTQRWSLE